MAIYYPRDPFRMTAARAHPASDQDIVTATWTKVTLGTEDYDYGANFASSRYTAPIAGVYLVIGNVVYNENLDATKVIYNAIYKNGAISQALVDTIIGAAGKPGLSVVDMLELAAGDYIELYAQHTQGVNREIDATYTYLSIKRVA